MLIRGDVGFSRKTLHNRSLHNISMGNVEYITHNKKVKSDPQPSCLWAYCGLPNLGLYLPYYLVSGLHFDIFESKQTNLCDRSCPPSSMLHFAHLCTINFLSRLVSCSSTHSLTSTHRSFGLAFWFHHCFSSRLLILLDYFHWLLVNYAFWTCKNSSHEGFRFLAGGNLWFRGSVKCKCPYVHDHSHLFDHSVDIDVSVTNSVCLNSVSQWILPVGRTLPYELSSSSLRVQTEHRRCSDQWDMQSVSLFVPFL